MEYSGTASRVDAVRCESDTVVSEHMSPSGADMEVSGGYLFLQADMIYAIV